MTPVTKTLFLFVATAAAELLGCYLPYLWLRRGASPLWLVPGAASLAAFAWLLSLHPALGAGRAYAAYGGVYIAAAVVWMWRVEGRAPDRWDVLGATLAIAGTCVIAFGPRRPA